MRGYGYWNPGVGHGAFTWSLLLILLTWACLIAVVFLFFYRRGDRSGVVHHFPGLHRYRALRLLDERLARGEITVDEFCRARDTLFGHPPSGAG